MHGIIVPCFCLGGTQNVSIENLLEFSTGSTEIPIMGFERQPHWEFQHNSMFPTASTCAPILRIPVLSSYDEFCTSMKLMALVSYDTGFIVFVSVSLLFVYLLKHGTLRAG